MTDSNMEGKKKKIETPETDALFKRIEETSITPEFDKWGTKAYARVGDFLDNRFLGNQKSFDQILEERSKRDNEYRRKQEEISEEITKTKTSQVIRGAITGPLKAANETIEFVDDIYDYLAGNPYDNNDLIDYSHFEREDDGGFYQIPQAITQFLLPMGIFSKGLRGIKNPWTRNLVAGFITDFVVEDPYEQNLYNMVDSYEGALEPIIDIFKMPASIFKADDDISPIEARLRKAFGGAVIGEAVTGLSVALKGFRNSPLAPKILATLERKRKLKFKDLGIDEAGNELLDEKVVDLIKPLDIKKTSTIPTDIELPDTRGQGKFYHGAAQEVKLVEGGEFGKGVENLYGDGFYTTDDLITGSKYQKKNKVKGETSTGIVYEVTEKQPVKFFDLDAPATPERIDQLRNIFNVGEYEAIDVVDRALDQIGSNASIAQIYDEIKLISNANDLSANTTANMFSHFTEELQREGFGGLTHRGGKKAAKGKRLHQVRIYFDPANSLEINPVNFNKFKAEPAVGEKIQSTFNPNLTGGGVESLRESLLNISEYFRDTDELGQWTRSVSLGDMYAASQRQSNGEALDAARFFLQEFGPYKKTKNGKIINNKNYLPSTAISINQMMNKNGEVLFNRSVALHNAIVTKNFDAIKQIKGEFIEEIKVLRGLTYLNKGVSSLTSQSLGARRIAGDLRDTPVTAKDFKKTSRGTENVDSLNKQFIEDVGTKEIDETFNKIFELVEKGDEEAALALTRLTKYLNIAGGNPEVMKHMVKKGLLLRGVEFTNEIFINSILSGPPTHVVNLLSTSLNTLMNPLSQSLGAAKIVFRKDMNIGYGKTILKQPSNLTFRPEFNNDEFIKGWKQFIYMGESLGDAFNVARKAFKANENVLDRGAMVQDAQRVSRNISAEDVRAFGDTNTATQTVVKPFVDLFLLDAYIPSIYNTFRNINGFGSRMLITEDEFLKQVNFRAYVKAEAWEKGVKAGKVGDDLTKYVRQQSEKVFKIVDDGSLKGLPQSITDLYKKAKDYAAEATFTKDLDPTSLSGRLQNFASHPVGRLVFPFVRTPINIFKTQAKYTPALNLAMGEYRQALRSTDSNIAARARGQMYIGSGFLFSAGLIAREIENPFAEMAMTGAGPNTVGFGDAIEANRTLVAQLKEEGWQPYSFRFLVRDRNGEPIITKSGKPKYKYISYKRLDPFSGILMGLADYVEIEGQIGSQQRNDWSVAATVSIARNLADRTYSRGMTELAEAIHNPYMMLSLLSRRAANIVNPVAGFGRATKKAIDKTKFDTKYYPADKTNTGLRLFLNEMTRTLPFYNADLKPDRNWITGSLVRYPNGYGPDTFDILNPITATTTKDNYVLSILNDLNIALQPPKKFFFGEAGEPDSRIELDRNTYDSYVKYLAFDTKIDGKRLIVALYQKLNEGPMKDFYKTAMGEGLDSTNEDIMVGAMDKARAKIAKQVKLIAADYKKKARIEWLQLPENKILYEKYMTRMEEVNDATIQAALDNYNKRKDLNSN